MAQGEEISDFIRSTFRSIWSLELLLHLSDNAGHGWSTTELVDELRASELIVSQSLDALVAAGLVSIGADGRARYAPASDDVARLTEAARERYRRAPNSVRRLIITSASAGLSTFADAFKYRKD